MNLIEVHSITATADPEIFDLDITADIGRGGPERIPFGYNPRDNAPLNFEVTAWLMSNPDFPINPYIPPPPLNPLNFPLTKRQINAALIESGQLDPEEFVLGILEAIADPVAKALAKNDWRNAPTYNRSHTLFNDPDLLLAAGMTSQDIDNLWSLAFTLPQ